ncbi:urease accessory protein [Alsobacter soli]|uniref:Urease accessory protein n=1 Tax=Alsobacter soli TaxID=2109933 RepID=A0A2T1HPA4_9HYPH|nr:HupE/UreJ family protein [Alsobacter soli]PSC03490.1 urease accessory protein [Alsobacter soli]
MKPHLPAAAAILIPLATPALAHTGLEPHMHGFGMGFAHPFSGLDHVIAMTAVGLWGGFVGGAARWAWPAAFIAAMAAAATLGSAGVALPFAETGIALSVAILGLAVACGVRAPIALGAALCAAFAVFHGYAHGAEAPMNAAGLAYGAGFLAATAALHLAGLALATVGKRTGSALSLRLAGGAVLAAGATLLVG